MTRTISEEKNEPMTDEEAAQMNYDLGRSRGHSEGRAEVARLRCACQTLGTVVTALSRSLKAAQIELVQEHPDQALQWILNAVEDTWDGDEWDGTESAQAWFDRTAVLP